MPRLSDVVATLNVRGKVFDKPEWWSSAHKLKRELKKTQWLKDIKANSDLRFSYSVSPLEPLSVDKYVSSCKDYCSTDKFAEFAPWNPMFAKVKSLILFKK